MGPGLKRVWTSKLSICGVLGISAVREKFPSSGQVDATPMTCFHSLVVDGSYLLALCWPLIYAVILRRQGSLSKYRISEV